MEIQLVLFTYWFGFLFKPTTADWSNRIERDIDYLKLHRREWEKVLTDPPHMWHVPIDVIGPGTWTTIFPPGARCGPCPEYLRGCRSRYYNMQANEDKIPDYFRNKTLCGFKQNQGWISDHLKYKGEVLRLEDFKSISLNPEAMCGRGNCYTVCLAFTGTPQCKEGYYFLDYANIICSIPQEDSQYPPVLQYSKIRGVKCCIADNDLDECNEIQEYSSYRPHFECVVGEYPEELTDKSFIWVALEYCSATERKFLCCYGGINDMTSQCYWTRCQNEFEILEREKNYIEEIFDCEGGSNSNPLCEVAQGGPTYYDLLKNCQPYEGKDLSLHSHFVFSESCELLWKMPTSVTLEEILSFKGINNQKPNELGLNPAGLRDLGKDKTSILDVIGIPSWMKRQ